MMDENFDIIFAGGGLSALLLLRALEPVAPNLRIAVIDPIKPSKKPLIHWSYWSDEPTYFDQFAIGKWHKAFVKGRGVEPLDPYTLRLVRSNVVLSQLEKDVSHLPTAWIKQRVTNISVAGEGYSVKCGDVTYHSKWVFDSIPRLEPQFPNPDQPFAFVSGTSIRVKSSKHLFDPEVASIFEPLNVHTLIYTLPINTREALVESARFSKVSARDTYKPLLNHLCKKWPDVSFKVLHSEYGKVPLGFAPAETLGSRHILLGTKRGSVKPSAGFGIMRILHDSERLSADFIAGRPLEPTSNSGYPWKVMDATFLKLLEHKPAASWRLLTKSMQKLPIRKSFAMLDETIPNLQAHALMLLLLPVVLTSLAHDK